MSWYLLKDREKIIKIIEHLISKKIDIKIRIEGEDTRYASRLIDIVPGSNQRDLSVSSDEGLEIVMNKLLPEKGNTRIQQFPDVGVEFSINEYLCRCYTKYVSINSIYPYYGLLMALPGFVELEEERKEERFTFQFPEFISASFEVVNRPGKETPYELEVINCSRQGFALLVREKDLDLLQIVEPGDRIPEIRLFAASALTRLDGVVRHKTKIEEGRYKGNYLLGLESNIPVEN